LAGVRGLAVLWIVIFHCLSAYGGSLPWPIKIGSLPDFVQQCARGTVLGSFSCGIEAIVAAIIQRGPQAVGVFLLFSGFGLTYSLTKRGGAEISWTLWYRRRLTRLFPVYWAAHLLFLVSPFTALHDRVDYHFLLSLLGDRIYPVDKMFFYLVPAWWFLGLLIELYIVFPLLFRLMQRVGWIKYLGICILLSSASRYVLTDLVEANGNYEMGAFFVCRLWEFAAGMALGKLIGERPDETLGRLLSWKGFFAGIIFYTLGIFSYQPNFWHVFTDGLTATGLSVILIHVAYRLDRTPGLGRSLTRAGVYSYGIYLLHQPYVIYAGEKLRSSSLGVFLILASALTVLIALLSICFEYTVNRAVNRVLGS
jgi:peptidoglycan/LPS O-acetylase OafA/YrhL